MINLWAPRRRLGIRMLFRIAILIVTVCAFIALTNASYNNVTVDELRRAEADMASELDYICGQLDTLDPQAIVHGYTVETDGTVLLIENGNVVATDDERLPVGSYAQALLGDKAATAIEESLSSGGMQRAEHAGAFEGAQNTGVYGDDADYALARQHQDCTVVIVRPSSMVLRDRDAIMARETIIASVIYAVVGFIVDALLGLMVLRRIDKTNEKLGMICDGDLDVRIDSAGTREFVSLASGINTTVEALQGWMAEAEERIAKELSAARSIQQSSLPSTYPAYPEIDQFDVYANMHAARQVGGDFYDYFLVGESGPDGGKVAFLIADVSGKGIPAALFMMKAMTQVRREIQDGHDLKLAIENANRLMAQDNDSCMFVTMWAAILDYGTGQLEYVNAGHNPPLLRQKGSGWSWLRDRSGIPLGFSPDRAYKTFELNLEPGSEILLYTDGVSEAMNEEREMFGEERLEAVCVAATDEHPQGLIEAVGAALETFVGGADQFDDITMLALELCEPTK